MGAIDLRTWLYSVDSSDDASVDLVDRFFACFTCRSRLRKKPAPGTRWTCGECGGVVEVSGPSKLAVPSTGSGLPVGRWCRDDLLWYVGAAVALERWRAASGGPEAPTSTLAKLWAGDSRDPERYGLRRPLGLELSTPSEADERRVRLEKIERTMDRVYARDPVHYSLLQRVWIVRRGVVDGDRAWWSRLARECATAEQLARWHHRPSVLIGWAQRELAAAVAEYDNFRAELP